MSRTSLKKRKTTGAIGAFKSALAIDPEYYEASNNLALEYFAAGNSELALKTLRELIKIDPKHVLLMKTWPFCCAD